MEDYLNQGDNLVSAGENKPKSDAYHAFSEVKNDTWRSWEENQTQEYREYRRRWEEVPRTLEVTNFPMHLDVESTANCNLRCTFCARTVRVDAGEWRGVKNVDPGLFKSIVDEIVAEGGYAMNLNNLGEPLLHPQLPELVAYAKEKGVLDVFFHTNGTVLVESKARALIESGLDKLIISFDSPYKKKYEQVRVRANYERVLNNIKNFARIKKEMGAIKPVTRINFIKLPGVTEQEMKDLVGLFKDHVDSIGFLDYVDPNRSEDKEAPSEYTPDYKSNFVCPQLYNRLMVWEDGRVFPCCMDYDGELPLGDLTKGQTLKEIWNGPKLSRLRKLHKDGKFHLIPACAKCEFAQKGDLKTRNSS